MKFKKEDIISFFKTLQQNICLSLEEMDGHKKFSTDLWSRDGGGGGCTRVLQKGKIFEKAGVAFSEVCGEIPDFLLKDVERDFPGVKVTERKFLATGVSIVIHPANPYIPIIHMNVRYFEIGDQVYWFGGGIDLTPIYIQTEDAKIFHTQLKTTCDQFSQDLYAQLKSNADEYFYIRHRKESRGIGGIFFDKLQDINQNISFNPFEFTKAVGNTFIPAYAELVRKNQNRNFGERELQWQSVRRSRYAEFNLVWDKGTRFGLETDGRIESILMSMPPMAKWVYNFIPETNSEEEKTSLLLSKKTNWL